MGNENEMNDINSENDVNEEVVVDENDDLDALTEKLEKISEQNKQLFARAKKAEGFELKDGKWVKPQKPEKPVEKTPSSEPSKPNELDYGQKAYLKSYGIAGSDELALVKQFQDRGFNLDSIVEDDVFTAKLTNLRDARASSNAIPKGKPRSGQPVINDLDEAMATYKETGELPKDFETRNKLIDKITDKENKGLFTGPSVIGPGMSQ